MSRFPGRSESVESVSRHPQSVRKRSISVEAETRAAASTSTAALSFYVSLPQLPEATKSRYKPVKESSVLLPKIDEVIGEYEKRPCKWYFARFEGSIASRYAHDVLEEYFPALLDIYRKKQAEGSLDPFDPAASYVHPRDRIDPTLDFSSLSSSPLSSLSTLSHDELGLISSSEGGYEFDRDDNIEYDDDGLPMKRPTRRNTRRRNRVPGHLPFSPKKTRGLVLTVPDDDEDSADPTRRRTRSRQLKLKFKYTNDDDDYGESEVETSSEDEYHIGSRKTSKGKTGKARAYKPKGPKPQYGIVRPIEDIDLDYFSDDEDRAFRVHRMICEKCHLEPANLKLKAWKKRKGRKKKWANDEDEEDEEVRIERLGGWVQCLKCCVSAHWGCMAQTQRAEVLKAIREKDAAKWKERHPDEEEDGAPSRRKELGIQEMTDFICGPCTRGGICMGCMEVAVDPLKETTQGPTTVSQEGDDTVMADDTQGDEPIRPSPKTSRELLYRCLACKRLSHYSHLRLPASFPSSTPLGEIAEYYQVDTSWLCSDCVSYNYPLDKIIAWRPYPPNATEPPRPNNEPPPYKERLPREYLVKWQDRSFRRLTWVPHMWLVSTNPAKLKNFLSEGTKVELLEEPAYDDEKQEEGKGDGEGIVFEVGTTGSEKEESRASSMKPGTGTHTPKPPTGALPDAERYIPLAWKTVDRVLDVVFWVSKKKRNQKKPNSKKNTRKRVVITEDEDEDEDEDGEEAEMRKMIYENGELSSMDNTETAEQWEERTGEKLSMEQMKEVVWAFIKWDSLGYEEASWDSPPQPGEKGYDGFRHAFERFVFSRTVVIPKLTAAHIAKFDNRVKDEYRKKYVLKDAADLMLGQEAKLKLLDFQVVGFNWLCDNWWNHQPCILADEMGLGKTVQVTTFLGFIAHKWKALPALVVVPNSTITNWVREFERWAPGLRVVPFYGEKKARDVIKSFELYHKTHSSTNTSAKFHVLVTTYENITGRDFTTVFKNQDRWEVLVVDEGQRLKSDASLLFRKLNELRSNHRVIMTGTPLNNNIRELFNLMNFLDPREWSDLEGLEKEYEDLNQERVKELHNRLRPYFLRRIKSEVLKLPAKNEVIVPVSMTPLQKQVFQSIYTHNFNLLNGLTQSKALGNIKGRLNNVLMHMRKCLQHPYLYSLDIEPKGLTNEETHEKLIHGSAKLRLLKVMLPRLKERGHRVLLFSQFVIALDVIEDFLQGEGYKFLRLDGSTKGSERQKGMDEFNRPGSDVFIYLLTTRAGGVGINLFSADTVIIFDPDFNPHQDLQAIARAYRYGQEKTCLVFKLMVKDSPEDRIMQVGKKKLVLDHLIVQKMDDDDDGPGADIQSILTYGAQKLFEDSDARDINYSDQDVIKLIERTEQHGEEEDKPKEGMGFSFAKVWAADKDTLEEVEDKDQADSWAVALKQIEAERAKEVSIAETETGRGRRRAAVVAKSKMGANELPGEQTVRPKKTKKPPRSDGSGSAYVASDRGESDGESSDIVMEDLDYKPNDTIQLHHPNFIGQNYEPADAVPPQPEPPNPKKTTCPKPVPVAHSKCGLCGEQHGMGECPMTTSSQNLAEFREMLILHADDEPWEARSAAIKAIDETLYSRGHLSLISGQPLHPIKPQPTNSKPTQLVNSTFASNVPMQQPPRQVVSKPQQQVQNARPVHQTQQETPDQYQPLQSNYLQSQSVNDMPITSTMHFVHSSSPMQTPGPSKRPISHAEAEPARKKAKGFDEMKCPVCEMYPSHLLKDCPAVREGSKSISQQIERLERLSGKRDTVEILRKLLRKAKYREMEMQME